MAERSDSGTIQKQVCVRVAKIVRETAARHLEFEALAAAGAQSTQFHEIAKKAKKGYPKRHFWAPRGSDLDALSSVGAILSILWEVCFQGVAGTESN